MAFDTAVLMVAALLVAATGAGLLLRRGYGRFRVSDPEPTQPTGIDPVLSSLGVSGGAVTLVQFSSTLCAPCRAARAVCSTVAGELAGVRFVEVDAESHLDAVRAMDVWRTPTVLIVDADGAVRRRATGVPHRDRLVAAIAEVLPG